MTPLLTGIIFLTVVVLLYSLAKAIMRYLDKRKQDNGKDY